MDSTALKGIEKVECDKYTKLYQEDYGSTGYQRKLSEFIRWTTDKGDKLLDIGCGKGIAVKFLRKSCHKATGIDITLEGVEGSRQGFMRMPAWDMSFEDDMFNCTFSTDVMEHIAPELVEKTIKEILRVTKEYTFHVVCTRASVFEPGLHPTVKPIEWWRAQFQKHNDREIKCVVMDCEEFLTLYMLKRTERSMCTDLAIIATDEREKYTQLYTGKYTATGYIIDTAQFIANTAKKGDKLLDLGTGHGRAVVYLRDRGFNCRGVDITLAGVPSDSSPGEFVQASLWDMPFEDNEIDYTFSTDVLEHIPPQMVEAVLKEIYRITRVETFHCISIVDDPNYLDVHLTIKPITWWKEQFAKVNTKQVGTYIVDPDTYATLCHYVNKRRVG